MKRKNLALALVIMITAPVFAQQADMSLIPYRHGDLWGYADPDRRIIVQPLYKEANLFYEGYACVKKDKMYGYIDKTGKVVIPFKYYSAKPFGPGYITQVGKQKTILFAKVSLQAKGIEICIDSSGAVISKCPAKIDSKIPDETKPVTAIAETNYSNIKKNDLFDKIVGDYKMVGSDNVYYIATKNNSYGVFNNKFDVVIPFDFSMIEKINSSSSMIYLKAEKNGMKGVFFGNGSPYIATDNNNLLHINANNGKDYFIISKDGRSYIKNTKYQELVAANYTDILYDTAGGFILIDQDNLKGYFFLNSSIVEPRYNDVKLVKGSEYIMVRTKSGKPGYVNYKGVEFFED